MLSLSLPVEIFLCAAPTDLRKSYDSLAALASEYLERNVLDGGLFVFLNRRRDRIKLLYWDRDGLAIWQKRLEAGRFSGSHETAGGARIELTATELALLLGGIDPRSVRATKRYRRIPASAAGSA